MTDRVQRKPIRPHPGGLSAFSLLRRPDVPELSESEYEQVLANMRESHDAQVLQDKMGTGKYWWDTIKHLPAMFLARMKKVDPETGDVRWLGQAPWPDLDDVGRGLMTMDEYREELAAAKAYNEAGRRYRSAWVDDVKSMAALPAILGNVAGEYIPGMPGSLSDPEEAFGYPEFAMEAAERVGIAERSAQDLMGVGDPEGFPQHLTGGVGAMLTQIPVPGAQIKGAAAPVTQQIAKRIPQSVKTATAVPRAILSPISEFANPFIDPSLKNYMSGAAVDALIGTALEPSASEIREIEHRQRQFDEMSDKVDIVVAEHWDETPDDVKLQLMYTPFAEQVMEALSEEERIEMIELLEEAGAFDDAE